MAVLLVVPDAAQTDEVHICPQKRPSYRLADRLFAVAIIRISRGDREVEPG